MTAPLIPQLQAALPAADASQAVPTYQQQDENSPEAWRRYLLNARQALHINPSDSEALQAVNDAVQVLNSFEQPMAELGGKLAGMSPANQDSYLENKTLANYAGGLAHGVAAPFQLAKTAVTAGPEAAMDQVVEGITSIPSTLQSGDPAAIGQLTGAVTGGATLLPYGLSALRRGPLGQMARRPALRNQQIESSISRNQAAEGVLNAKRGSIEQLTPTQVGLNQARTGTANAATMRAQNAAQWLQQQMQQSGAQQPHRLAQLQSAAESARLRVQQQGQAMSQRGQMHPEQLENVQLRNELLRRQLEGEGPETAPPSAANPQAPKGPASPAGPKAPTDWPPFEENAILPDMTAQNPALSRMPGTTKGFEVHGTSPTPPVPNVPTLGELLSGMTKRIRK